MLILNHHIFTHKDRIYLLDIENLKSISIDENVATALKTVRRNSYLKLTPEILKTLIKLRLTIEEKPKRIIENEVGYVPISHIALFVTQECNLNCIYCYGDGGNYGCSGHLTSNIAQKAVDWLIEHSGDLKNLNISFFGGEPLLNFPVIKEVVEYARKMGHINNKEFKFGITTNLSLLNNEKLVFLKENNITTNVSFDGPKETQDKQRPFKKGKGSSYDIILPKIKQLLSVIPNAFCRATILGDTDPVTVRNALCELGFLNIVITSASPSIHGRAMKVMNRNISGTLQMLESDAESLLINIKNKHTQNLQKQIKYAGFLIAVLDKFLNGTKRDFPCGAGRSYVAISNSGDIFLCHRFVGTEEYKIGNVFKSKLKREPYLISPTKTIKKCAECFAKYICAGRCYYDNKVTTGSEFIPSEYNCKLMKRTIELIAYISSNLNSDDKYYLANENFIANMPLSKNEIKQKQEKIMADFKDLRLEKAELEEVVDGLSSQELKSQLLSAFS